MRLKNITFVFENCDTITIDGKYIGDFLVSDLKTEIKRIACNAIERMDIAGTVAIEIHKDANKEYYQFGQNQYEKFKTKVFDRLADNDITSIEFELEQSYEGIEEKTESYCYYVSWVGESDYYNDAQKCYFSDEGHLYITIAEGKKTEDFFDLEEINDSDSMDFHFDMYDVGDVYGDPKRYEKE